MPDWSVKIIPAANPTPAAPAAFQPDLIGAKPGDPLNVQDDDIVTWNNTTSQDHWPWPTDASYTPLSDAVVAATPALNLSNRIKPNSSSRPSYNVLIPNSAATPPPTSGTIYYCCKLHPQERGTIAVTAVPS